MDHITSNFIIVCLVLSSLFFIKKYRFLGVVIAAALIGSDTDSAGILYAVLKYVPFYKVIVRGFILSVYLYSIYAVFRYYLQGKIKSVFMFWYYFPLLILSFLVFIINFTRGNGLIISLSEVIWLGIPFFSIWTLGAIELNSDEALKKLLFIQAIVAMIILLLGPVVRSINGVSYAYIIGADSWKNLFEIVINSKISIGNFSKQSLDVLKFAQFHNPNSLGVYSTVFLVVAINFFLQRKPRIDKFLSAVFFLAVGLIGWFNSLTRGPIFIVMLVLMVYFLGVLFKPLSKKRIILFFVLCYFAILNFNTLSRLADYMFVDSTNISITSRISGFDYAFNAISNNPVFGVETDEDDPIPHILPLKIATNYGLPAAILITIPFLHLIVTTIRVFISDFIKEKPENALYPSMIAGVIVGAYLTNGIVVYVLFWVLLSEALNKFQILKPLKYPEIEESSGLVQGFPPVIKVMSDS